MLQCPAPCHNTSGYHGYSALTLYFSWSQSSGHATQVVKDFGPIKGGQYVLILSKVGNVFWSCHRWAMCFDLAKSGEMCFGKLLCLIPAGGHIFLNPFDLSNSPFHWNCHVVDRKQDGRLSICCLWGETWDNSLIFFTCGVGGGLG